VVSEILFHTVSLIVCLMRSRGGYFPNFNPLTFIEKMTISGGPKAIVTEHVDRGRQFFSSFLKHSIMKCCNKNSIHTENSDMFLVYITIYALLRTIKKVKGLNFMKPSNSFLGSGDTYGVNFNFQNTMPSTNGMNLLTGNTYSWVLLLRLVVLYCSCIYSYYYFG